MLVKNIRELQYTHIALDQENRLYLIGYKLHIIIFFICGKIIPDGFLMSMQFYTTQKGGLVLEYHNASRWAIDYSSNKLPFDQFLCDTWQFLEEVFGVIFWVLTALLNNSLLILLILPPDWISFLDYLLDFGWIAGLLSSSLIGRATIDFPCVATRLLYDFHGTRKGLKAMIRLKGRFSDFFLSVMEILVTGRYLFLKNFQIQKKETKYHYFPLVIRGLRSLWFPHSENAVS